MVPQFLYVRCSMGSWLIVGTDASFQSYDEAVEPLVEGQETKGRQG